MNLALFLGNIVQDPERRVTSTGLAVLNFTIASNERYPKGSPPIFQKCAIFGKLAEQLTPHLRKGTQVLAIGRQQKQEWTDRQGQKREHLQLVADKVELLGGPRAANGEPPPPPPNEPAMPPDELPFDENPPPTFG